MTFRISDIPEGKSEQEFVLNDSVLPLEGVGHKGGLLKVELLKANGIIRLFYHATTTVEVTCDRSLDLFDFNVDCRYEVVFKPGAEESEDDRCAIRPLNISGNSIEIQNEVRDSILLSIPVKKIHPRFYDEQGNITEFVKIFEGETESDNSQPDSRWDALKVLKKNQNN
jgi:uncharacterized metal-binding protein YceD (DUF177 family)